MIQFGAVLPQVEIGHDDDAVRRFVLATAAADFDYLAIYDHVVGADPTHHRGWDGPYSHTDPFREPMVFLGWVAALTSLGLATTVLITPQRQTVLIAKQAAEVDRLSGGRFRLGAGIGWNPVEYEALGVPYRQRGARLEEQIALLRQLWTSDVVDFNGRWHRVTGAGIAPPPRQRPIPIWLAAGVNSPGLSRVGRLADGWLPPFAPPDEQIVAALAEIRSAAVAADRDPSSLGLEGRVHAGGPVSAAASANTAARWRELGATHVAVDTVGAGLGDVEAHLSAQSEALARIRAVCA